MLLTFCLTLANSCDSDPQPDPQPDPTTPDPTEGSSDNTVEPEQPAPIEGFVQDTLRQEELRGIAMEALQGGDMDLAIAALISLVETPEMSLLSASGALMLAELYHSEDDGERALQVLEDLIENAPPMAEFEFVYGRTLGELERFDPAEEHLRRAIELEPAFLQSYLYLGSVLVAQEQEDDAADVYLEYEQALASLLNAVRDTTSDATARMRAIEQVGLASPDERITAALVDLLSEDSVFVNAAALRSLAQVGTAAAIRPLLEFAQNATEPQLQQAAQATAQQIAMRDQSFMEQLVTP